MKEPDREAADEDLVPVSVRLGEVVPPEDPEDWTRPLTWVAALGMLAGPLVALAWFVIAPPAQGSVPEPATLAVALALAGGAVMTGATQQGVARAVTATLGAGLFGALVVVMLGVVMAGERQVGVASPTLAQAFAAAAGGLAGVAAGALAVGVATMAWGRPAPAIAGLAASLTVAAVALSALMPWEAASAK